jgi:hypothetical protein
MSSQKNGSNIEAMKVVFQAHSGRWRNKSIKDKRKHLLEWHAGEEKIQWKAQTEGEKHFFSGT